jgi:hypothetical protein
LVDWKLALIPCVDLTQDWQFVKVLRLIDIHPHVHTLISGHTRHAREVYVYMGPI